ncbi:nuclease-related domain-containing protein [Neobacillus niacini]|uniref:nuclease-related domain-containing protein n=1 Tax=Neobacillus niacini TaxID=86668 RepID=UPI0005ED7B36|nr:nuclease-related domain-containing protein [Neobacillus niacini]
MPLKSRSKSKELKVYTSLNSRMDLEPSDRKKYTNLKKGYDGEVMFDSLTASLDKKFLIINDLNLKSENTTFQIDSLIITKGTVIPWEVKNYKGNYYYENDNFYLCTNRKPITNPLHQLNRCETLLRPLLHSKGFHLPIEGYVSFINPEFFLYQAPQKKNIIFQPQLKFFLNELSMLPSNINGMHKNLADFLLNAHISEPDNMRFPLYEYEQLRKGFICACCQSFSVTPFEKKIVCNDCGYEESLQSAVIRSIEELVLLFPNIKITANLVYDWCNFDELKRKIRRILPKNYKIIGHGPHSYYVNK